MKNYWVIIPAAGIGRRMGASLPKQYLPLNGKTVLEYTLDCFVSHPHISGIILVIAADDAYWPALAPRYGQQVTSVIGGAERFQSVLNGLNQLADSADADDWVLVHDAVRPCLRHSDVDSLIASLSTHTVGGLLGLPIADTIKYCNPDGTVANTVPRDHLWRALTPQMFRFSTLRNALQKATEDGVLVTDEAAAIEYIGHRPQLVVGRADNIKITRPDDLRLAQWYLQERSVYQ